MPHGGKEANEFMEKVVYSNLGRRSAAVVVGPGRGLDNAVVSVGGGRVMIVTVDPVSVIPAFGFSTSAWLSVHLVASDFASSGVDPQFAVFSYNFPSEMDSAQREEYVRAIGNECRRLGVSIAAGHTGSYPGGGYTVIGSGAMLGTTSGDAYVTPAMAKAGHAILVTKQAGIEATATLAASFRNNLASRIGATVVRRGAAMVKMCSTVEDARTARKVGLGGDGVSSMHDATEGGVLGALDEMAQASGKRFDVNAEQIPVSKETRAICGAFGLDPLRTMGEGALLITCAPERVPELKKGLAMKGIPATEIGSVSSGRGLKFTRGGTRQQAYVQGRDMFWSAYDRASRGLRAERASGKLN